MGTIAVTPRGAAVIADPKSRTIVFPAWKEMVQVDAKLARAKGADRIGPKDMEERIEDLLKRNKKVDLAGNGQIRFGAGFVLYDLAKNGRPVFGSFDSTHPVRPNFLTPASGLVESLSVFETCLNELAEEMILVFGNRVGLWAVNGKPLSDKRAREYAEYKGLTFDASLIVNITLIETPFHWQVAFGDEITPMLVEFEADTSSIELMVTGEATIPADCKIVDGEKIGDKWRNSEVVYGYPLTSKAAMSTFVADERAKAKKKSA